MPTYEYACKSCGEHLEVVQSFSDDALTECPACQGELRKVFSAAGIIFKGSGWHIKDYKSGGGADPGPAGTSSDSSSSDSSSSGSSSGDGGGSSKSKDTSTPSSSSSSSTTSSSTGSTSGD